MDATTTLSNGLTTAVLINYLNAIFLGLDATITVPTCFTVLRSGESNNIYIYCLLRVNQLRFREEAIAVHQRFVDLHRNRSRLYPIAISYMFPTVYKGTHNNIGLLEIKACKNQVGYFEYDWNRVRVDELPSPESLDCGPPTYIWIYLAREPLITLNPLDLQRRFLCVGIENKSGFHRVSYLSFHLISNVDTNTNLEDIFTLLQESRFSADLRHDHWELENVVKRIYTQPLDTTPQLTRIVVIYKRTSHP